MGFLESILSSVISGGATGILGVAVHRYFDVKSQKLNLEIQRHKFRHELESMKLQAQLIEAEAAAEINVVSEEFAGRAFEASFSEPKRYSAGIKMSTPQRWMMVILDFIRGLVRPVLTTYLCVITTLIYLQAQQLLEGFGGSSLDEVTGVVNMTVRTVLYLTTTCVLWWFGTRNKQKPPKWK